MRRRVNAFIDLVLCDKLPSLHVMVYDFVEILYFDECQSLFTLPHVFVSGESAASYHNRYPEEWAKLTMEVLAENNRQEDVLFFMRSAWMKSPSYNSIFWEGDQLVNWDENDGLKNVVLGALSGGLSGHAISHSDIGGYTVTSYPVPGCTYMRTEELLGRWTELSTFGAGLFRTHVGSSTSTENFNVYDSADSIAHFAKFATIYGALKSYRDQLITEAVELGLPLIRWVYIPSSCTYGVLFVILFTNLILVIYSYQQ